MKIPQVSMLVFLAAITFAAETSAQDTTHYFDRFRVLLTNGRRVEATGGFLTTDSLTATVSDGDRFSVSRDRIRALDHCVGSKAGTGALIGAGMGALSVAFAYLQIESDDNTATNDGAFVPLLAGFTAAGGLIGMAVGSASKKWERVPLEPVVNLGKTGKASITLTFRF